VSDRCIINQRYYLSLGQQSIRSVAFLFGVDLQNRIQE
jgi:hypothetical protein